MKKNWTELILILDKSGSMSGLEGDTIGGYNSMLERQKAVGGACRVTTVLFNQSCELLHDRADLRTVRPMRREQYVAGGATALMDAVGMAIARTIAAQVGAPKRERAEKVMFVIITDGEENASRMYSAAQVRQMIRRQREKYGWEFLFLGANIDAVETAGRFGIDASRAADYVPDGEGTRLNFRVMGEAMATFRACGAVDGACLQEIRSDMQRRGGRG